jgi:hypothetical protein
MDSPQAAAMCAQYHISRAQMLLDALADVDRLRDQRSATTLRVIKSELTLAAQQLGAPSHVQRTLNDTVRMLTEVSGY